MTDDTPDTAESEVGVFSLWFLRGALALTCLVVLGFLIHAAVGLFDRGGDGDETAVSDSSATTTTAGPTTTAPPPSTSSTTTEAPTTTQAPTTGDDDAELQAFVDEAIAFIEAVRQREFVERPVVEVVDVDAMTRIVLDDIADQLTADPEAAAASLAFARAIGFFGPDDEFLEVFEVFVSGGVLGVYFPNTDQLLVRFTGELTLSTKATIVHELVHAFDDQHFDLDRDELSQDGDAGWSFTAAVEGSASWVEEAWRDTLSPKEAAALQVEELSFDPGDIFSLDFGFLIYETSVYEAGRTWLDRRVATEGLAALDDALTNGAPSSEAVVEPLSAPGLEPVEVPFPAVEGEVLWRGRGGRALVAALTFLTDPDEVGATGWGGDAITVYRSADGAECLRWDLVGDTPADTTELLIELDRWAKAVGGAIERVDDVVRVDRCA